MDITKSIYLVLITLLLSEVETQNTKKDISMAQQMLSDMGLNQRPDIKNANISLEEYSLMYGVYQRSVRQTEAITNLQKLVKISDSTKSHDFAHIVSPKNKVGRRRRNEFEDFVHYKPNINSILMKFDKQDLLGDSALYENNFHVVQEATLTIKLIRSSAKEIMTPLLKSPLTFTLYQLMEEAKVRPEAAIVTDIVRIGGSGDDDHLNEFTEILEFNAADMVQSWILDDQTNFGLRIECDLCHTLGIHFGNEDVSLALKIHTTDNQLAITRRSSIISDMAEMSHFMADDAHKSCISRKNKKSPRCCLDSMTVDLNQIPGFEFIQQPRIFDAHLCRGRCPPRFNMANDHAMLQSIMHLKTRHQIHGKIPKPCCVGRKFRPLDILHVDDLDPTKLKVTRWKDVIVTECGCI